MKRDLTEPSWAGLDAAFRFKYGGWSSGKYTGDARDVHQCLWTCLRLTGQIVRGCSTIIIHQGGADSTPAVYPRNDDQPRQPFSALSEQLRPRGRCEVRLISSTHSKIRKFSRFVILLSASCKITGPASCRITGLMSNIYPGN